MPQVAPYAPMRLFAIGAGQLLNNRTLTIGPHDDVEILKWENAPLHFFMSVLGISFTNGILPYVGLVVNFDRKLDVADWTAEEYEHVLGLNATKTALPLYGAAAFTMPLLITTWPSQIGTI